MVAALRLHLWRSLMSLIASLPLQEANLASLPANLKEKCMHVMSKRGLLTDQNIAKVLHRNLKSLDLTSCSISDQTLQRMTICPQLTKIDLNSAGQARISVTSSGILSLAGSCRHLRVVLLARCINITDDAIVHMSQQCPLLIELNVAGCRQLTDRSLKALGKNSHHLQGLNFSRTAITDNGIFSLVSGECAKTLQELHLNGCVKLTDLAIEGVAGFCTSMKVLFLHDCPKLTENSRIALEELYHGQGRMKHVTWTIY